MNRLTKIQLEALENVKKRTFDLNPKSEKIIIDIFKQNSLDESLIELVLKNIEKNAQVLIHFHPDRISNKGKSVAQLLYEEGSYKTQFETGISNGGLTAFRGGQRDNWEKGLFGGVYQKEETEMSERPKYGALDLLNFSDGAAPRFGSCYFRLNTEVSKRCSFTNKDSYHEPEYFGTIDNFINILAALFEELANKQEVLAVKNLTIYDFIIKLSNFSNPKVNQSSNYGRNLDDYIEAQIHGPIELEKDVITLVADPSFKNTKTGDYLQLISEKYNIKLDWHGGFQIHTSKIPDEFRGPKIPILAKRLVGESFINTKIVGDAAVSVIENSEQWQDWGTPEETIQHLKQLWHVLAYYGKSLS